MADTVKLEGFSRTTNWFFMVFFTCLVGPAMCQITLVGEDPLKIEDQDFLTMPRLLVSFYLKVECINNANDKGGMCFNLDVGGVGSNYVATISYFEKAVKVFVKDTRGDFSFSYLSLGGKWWNPNEWTSVVVYVAWFEDAYKAVALVNGKGIKEKDTEMGNIADVSPSMRTGDRAQGASDLLNGFVRNVYLFGPERLTLPKNISVNNAGIAALHTEFYSHNDTFYEIFCIENFQKPWVYSNLCKMQHYSKIASKCTYIGGNEYVDFEVIWDKQNVPVGARFRAPTNGTYQHMCEIVYWIRNPSSIGDPTKSLLIPMVYAHSGDGFDMMDVSSMLTNPLPKTDENCERTINCNWRPSRSNSSNSILRFSMLKSENCNADSKDVTILLHHQTLYVSPMHITMVQLDCLKPTILSITKSYVRIKFKHIPAHSNICFYVHYLVLQSVDISQVISISAEIHYSNIKEGVGEKKVVRRVFNSNLLEFKGYYIKNLDQRCCLALDSEKTVICSTDTDKCIPVKEASSRFETRFYGCLTLERPNIVAKQCAVPYHSKAQVMQWDASDIVFSEEDQKLGMFAHVTSEKSCGVSRAKRVSRFTQVVIHQKHPPVKCYKKDVSRFGVVKKNISNTDSWETCSHYCKNSSTCDGWNWNFNSTVCMLLSNVGWRNKEIWKRGVMWENSRDTLSGDRACVGHIEKKKKSNEAAESIADASVLVLNEKMYFCSHVLGSEKSACYKHELDKLDVKRIPTSFVEIIGGNQYSNMLYGRDRKGQIIHFKSADQTYMIVSEGTMKTTEKVNGFVAAKSYNRSQLLDGMLTGQFAVHDETYAISYYGIHREKEKSNLVIWLPQTDCERKVAYNKHLALTSCTEIKDYCAYVATGLFALKRKNGDKEMRYCEFDTKKEKQTVVDSTPLTLPVYENETIYRGINLHKGFTMNFQFKLTKAARTENMHEVVSFSTESRVQQTKFAFILREYRKKFYNKNKVRLVFRERRDEALQAFLFDSPAYYSIPVNMWNDVEITSTESGTTCYLNGEKIIEGEGRDTSHDDWRSLVMKRTERKWNTVNGLIRNFEVRKDFQPGV